ncbi:MAG: hypothetical protein WA049_06580 [Ferribacterium limneticum]
MAVKLIMRTTRDEFIDYIRNAEEGEAWGAICEACGAVSQIRMSNRDRAELNRTLDKAILAYETTFSFPWVPF